MALAIFFSRGLERKETYVVEFGRVGCRVVLREDARHRRVVDVPGRVRAAICHARFGFVHYEQQREHHGGEEEDWTTRHGRRASENQAHLDKVCHFANKTGEKDSARREQKARNTATETETETETEKQKQSSDETAPHRQPAQAADLYLQLDR